ncbi:hypothetical protein MTBLM1_70028 [Rhodospirillaceae bacterium LM-1]|nr:hypothetical protein MTBLM1_70028 [Rhodospirillaceae bacterium LM-1]
MMNSDITIDLFMDFADRCASELQAAGYTRPPDPAENIIRAYANVRHRRVEQRPRKVHKASYSIPIELIEGEQTFLKKVEDGGDLRPHQSTKLEKADYDDGMLNDFGIQHFHLGTAPHPTNPNFIGRTDLLLFALVKDNDFYSLGCYAHETWSKTSLLDLIHATWPKEIVSSSLSSVSGMEIQALSHNYTDEDVAGLRKVGVNAITQRPDGTIHVGLGGGVTMNGESTKAARKVACIKRKCNDIERELKSHLTSMISSAKLSPPVAVYLEQRGTKAFAVIKDCQVEFDLGRQLFVLPL